MGDELKSEPAKTTENSAEKSAIDDFSNHRILLVEDMKINREIVLMLLESTNLEIDCAENGIQAVEMFAKEPKKYEVIFMDIHMPKMDGYEATKKIRILEKNANTNHVCTSFTYGETRSNNGDSLKRIPIIAMTANVLKEDINKCTNAGMDDHVGKPIVLETILEKLRYYLTAS